MSITKAFSDLISSFYELLSSIFGAAYSIISSVINAVVGFITGIFSLAGNVLEGLIKAAGGLGKFVAGKSSSAIAAIRDSIRDVNTDQRFTFTGNLVVLGLGAIAMFAFVTYTAQGQRLVGQKKKTA